MSEVCDYVIQMKNKQDKIPKYKKYNYKKLIAEKNKLTNCDESTGIKLLRIIIQPAHNSEILAKNRARNRKNLIANR